MVETKLGMVWECSRDLDAVPLLRARVAQRLAAFADENWLLRLCLLKYKCLGIQEHGMPSKDQVYNRGCRWRRSRGEQCMGWTHLQRPKMFGKVGPGGFNVLMEESAPAVLTFQATRKEFDLSTLATSPNAWNQ